MVNAKKDKKGIIDPIFKPKNSGDSKSIVDPTWKPKGEAGIVDPTFLKGKKEKRA